MLLLSLALATTVACADNPMSPGMAKGNGGGGGGGGKGSSGGELFVMPAEDTLLVGSTLQLTVQDGSGTLLSANWSSSSSAVASVSNSGLVSASSPGSVTITAKVKNRSATARLAVLAAPSRVDSIHVTPLEATVTVGGSAQFTAAAYDAEGEPVTNEPIEWSSSNTSVATVSATGSVSAVAAGKATISAKAGTKSRSGILTVNEAPAPVIGSVVVAPASVSVLVGGTVQLAATVKDTDGNTMTGQSVTWSSSNAAIASVTAAGVVSGVASGSAVVTASAGGKTNGSAITVSAAAPPPSWGTPDFAAIKRGIRPRGFGGAAYSLTAPAAGGMTYYVSPNGSDNNTGSSTFPFRSINKAAQMAVAGDVVVIRDGTYRESVMVRNSGTADKPIVFQAENRGGVVLTGGTYVFQPANWVGQIGLTPQKYVTVKGLIFREYAQNQNGYQALRTGPGWRVEDCLFDRSAHTGITINDHDVTLIRTTLQYHHTNAYTVYGGFGGQGTSPSDPAFTPIRGLRLIDMVIRGNNTTTDPVTGNLGNYVSKIGLSRGTLIDNIESYENNGTGIWFDEKSVDYVIRNSYIHSNKGMVVNGTYRPEMGRGIYLEKLWAGGVVENNLIINNTGPGIMLVNTNGLTIRNNLIARNDLCVTYVNMTTSGYELFTLKDIAILNNQCKDWARWSGIHAMGGTFTTPWEMNIQADGNTYEAVRSPSLAWWPDIREANTISQAQSKFRWEQNGRVGSISVP